MSVFLKLFSCTFVYTPVISLTRVAAAAALGEYEIPLGFQQFLVVLLTTHQDVTK